MLWLLPTLQVNDKSIFQTRKINLIAKKCTGFPGGKESACNAGDLALLPGLGRSLGGGNSYWLQSSGEENSMDCISTGSQRVGHDWKTFTLLLSQLSHKGSPRILEWIPYPFSSRSSWPRNYYSISCIAGGFFTTWALKEVYQKTNMEYSLINCVFFFFWWGVVWNWICG